MSHRMDIELTSSRGDEIFTWRAAGARQPRGAVAASLLPKGSKIGDVVRIEAEVEIDGITVLAVLPPKEKQTPSGRIEVVGTKRPVGAVTTVLAGPLERRRESRFFREGDERRPARPAGDRRPRREGNGPDDSRTRPPDSGEQSLGAEGERARIGPRERSEGNRSAGARSRPGSGVASARRDLSPPRPERPKAGTGARSAVTRGPRAESSPRTRSGGASGGELGSHGPRPAREGERAGRPKKGAVRLEAGTNHRDELMAKLPPEQQVIAERLAAGGLPAMRKAIAEEQERAALAGRPAVAADSILALAEQLQPDVKSAVWMDRAEAALAQLQELGLRDLRATVIAAAPRDDAGRDLERQLREGLEHRVAKLRSGWEERLAQSLADGKVLQALRLSARPPEPTARFPAGLIERLVNQVGAAMSAETPPDRWLALLEAVVACPVRRQIKPAGIPEDASGGVQRKAREAAGRVPALAPMLGMAMPPPPKPIPGERPSRTRPLGPPRPAGSRPRSGAGRWRSDDPASMGSAQPQTAGSPGGRPQAPEAAVVVEPPEGV